MNEQINLLNKLYSMQQELSNVQSQYWKLYSNFNTWQFWLSLSLFIVPLIILYFFIDKDKIFLMGFYGFCTHMLINYVDSIAVNLGYWQYNYSLAPFLSLSVPFDVALVPVVLMLVYQWTLKHNKNFYIYSIMAAFLLATVWTPIYTSLGILKLYKGTNFLTIFVLKTGVVLLSKFIVNLFFYKKIHNY